MKHSAIGLTEGRITRLAIATAILMLAATLARAQQQTQAQPLPPPPPPTQSLPQPVEPQQPPPQQAPVPNRPQAPEQEPAVLRRRCRSCRCRRPIELEESSRWTRTLERISTGVVAIQIDRPRAFDTEWNTSAQATGFVVDAEHGIILTNRHVVTPGPVNGACDLPEPRGSRARSDLPRSRARLRLLPLRPVEAALHPAGRTAALPGGRAGRRRDPRGRQRCRRAAVDPRRHARAPRPPGAGLRRRPATTTSTRSTTRPRPAPRAARRARRCIDIDAAACSR